MNSISKSLSAMFAVLIITVVTPVVAGEVKPWSASEVLEISDELSNAARRLRIECRSSPPKYHEDTSGWHLEFRYHVRHFLSVSYQLNNALEDGAGREKTKPMYDTLAGMKEGLNFYANRPGGAWLGVTKAVENVDKYLTQLDAYYSGG